MKYNKPKILISKCLEFEACRYDGQIITNKYVKLLKNYIDFITICPEVEIGLGIPRDPIHLINNNDNLSLYQPTTKRDLGNKMQSFSEKFINSLDYIDGIILKSKSPSCAINTAKHYRTNTAKQTMGRGAGLFANNIIKKFQDTPKEEETRLNDNFLREHFYTSIFTISDFRDVKTFNELYDFHSKHKLLFMTYNQTKLRILGSIAANHENHQIDEVIKKYYQLLLKIFTKRPRYVSNINTQMHAFGYYKNNLSKKEKKYFFNLLDDYKNNLTPIYTINSIINSWNIRFNNEYLLKQSYFQPFPKGLIDLNESRIKFVK